MKIKLARFTTALLVFCSIAELPVFAKVDPASYSGKRQKRLVVRNLGWSADELTLRPRQGIIFLPSRAAVIGATGELESASGDPEDCIRVDGSSGPCGVSGGGSAVRSK